MPQTDILSDGQQGEQSHWFQNLVQLYVSLWENDFFLLDLKE